MTNLFVRAGAWCWIITGVVHNAIDIATRISPPESEKQLNTLLRGLPFDLLGMGHSYYEVTMGISLGMGVAMVVVGVLFLFLFLARTITDAGRLGQVSFIGLAASLSMLAIAISFEPLPPIITFGIASLFFALALSTRSRHVSTAPQYQRSAASR